MPHQLLPEQGPFSSDQKQKDRLNAPAPASGALPCLQGTVNVYTPVTGFGCDSSTLQVGTAPGFAPGDKVLLIQMQVPQVDLSNTAAFGTVLNTTCIGNYEFNRILSISPGQIQLQYLLTRPYDVSGKVQLVRVPEYDSAAVCNLTCLPWNGTTGGVLVLDVKNQLTLIGNMDVSAKGFRGGIVEPNFIPWIFGEQQYFYPPVSTLAAAKGEGIAIVPTAFSYGRGRAGNGGGGGNAHNGGGGGGANGGSGGNGGLEITNIPATPTPNTDGIGGQKYFDFSPDRIFLGGGAGAGHANDALGTAGGQGGGILMLLAGTLQVNGFRLLANGENVLGGIDFKDGQGGGGGGGAILLKANQVNGALVCEAKGGSGGSNPYTPDFQLHGPGGGGGGGKLLFSQNFPGLLPAFQGGLNGFTSQGLTNGAQPGETGKMFTGVAPTEGSTPAFPVSNNLIFNLQQPPCAGAGGGQIQLTQTNASAFRLNGGPWQPQAIFSGLSAGTYQIDLQFAGGCIIDTTVVLIDPPPVLEWLVLLSGETCLQLGQLIVQAQSGMAPFQFQLDGGPWQANGTFSGLVAGPHQFTLRDAAGCTHSSTYIVTPPPAAIVDSLIQLSASTCDNGGQLTVTGLSGTPPFQYQLNNGAMQGNGNFSNLPAGPYLLTISDFGGCTHNSMYVVSSPPPALDTLLALVDETCDTAGQISVAAVSGTPPYQFQLNGGPWQSGGDFPGLSAGTYQITLRDAGGCTHTATYTVAPPPPVLDTLLSLTAASCNVGGQISVGAMSGTPPYQFQLNGGPWQAGGDFLGLSAGTYQITLRDWGGCTKTSEYTIQTPPPVVLSLLSLTDATCVAGGQISVAAGSGTAPYQFQLDGGTWQSGSIFSGLAAGVHTIILRDDGGCEDISQYTVAPPTPVTLVLQSITGATCEQGGQITVAGSAGMPPFQFQRSGGLPQTNGNFSGLAPGVYTLLIRDAGGCTDSSQYTITAPPPVLDSLISLIDPSCDLGGQISVAAVSGTPPVLFQIDGGPTQAGGIFTDLPAGLHTLILRDDAGCADTSFYTFIPPPPVLDSLVLLVGATCDEGGQIGVQAISGTPSFLFRIDGGVLQIGGLFIDLAAGPHTVQVLDAGGCTHSSIYTVAPPQIPPMPALLLSEGCVPAEGQIEVLPSMATAFSLNGGPWQAGTVFNGLLPGNYLLGFQFPGGCIVDTTVLIKTPEPVLDSLVTLVGEICDEGGVLIVSAISGVSPFLFQLNGGAPQANGIFSDLPDGTYTLLLRDARGCAHNSKYTISPYPPLLLQLDSLASVDCRRPLGFAAVSAKGGLGGYTYSLGNGPSQLGGYFPGLVPGQYGLTVYDSLGCEAQIPWLLIGNFIDSVHTYETDTIYEGAFYRLPDGSQTNRPGQYTFDYENLAGCDSLHTIKLILLPRHLYAPNVIHPDGDGWNDFFTLFGDRSVLLIRRMQVYDRWGELLFEGRDVPVNQEGKGWDGTFRGRPVGVGVYVWVAEVEFVDGVMRLYEGDVTVVR